MAPGQPPPESFWRQIADKGIDSVVTLACWVYFTLGFIVIFAPLYLGASLFSANRELAFQHLNRRFYRGFFSLLRALSPRQRWTIDQDIASIRSSVILCNHLSYLDPLLLIALLGRARTIVKPAFFRVPIFGRVIRTAGYLPATTGGKYSELMLNQMETMAGYLAGGGNLFIFPEGTRSRDGRLGSLNQGALKIARLCHAPICAIRLSGTDKLFTPGRFFFRTREANTISALIVERIEPHPHQPAARLSLSEIEQRVRQAFSTTTGNRR